MGVVLTIGVEYTTITGLAIRPAQALEDSLRYLSAGATQYNPAYASGRWDGYVRLYEKYFSRFPTGLLPRVKAILAREGVEFTIEKNLPNFPNPIDLVRKDKVSLRPYQEEAVASILKYKRGIIRIPTGGGKTHVAIQAIERMQMPRVVFLVPSKVLVNQTYLRMVEAFPDFPIFKWGDGSKPITGCPDNYILVSTTQSAWRHLGNPLLKNATVVFVDESHHQAADTFKKVTRECNQARYLVGLSATPFRDDGADLELEAWLGPLIYQIGYEELINDGFLVEPVFRKTPHLDEAIIQTKGLRTLIFTEQIRSLDGGNGHFTTHGVRVHTGKDTSKAIQASLRELESGSLNHIAATPIFDEGLDLPNLDAIIFFETCRSRTRAIQRIGRAMRPAPGKTKCYVWDIIDKNYPYRVDAYLQEPAFARRYKGL